MLEANDIINPNRDKKLIREASKRRSKKLFDRWYNNRYLRSKHWKKVREILLVEVGNKCQKCGDTKILQCHHLCYDNLGQEVRKDLVVLCKKCHTNCHRIKEFRDWRKDPKNYNLLYGISTKEGLSKWFMIISQQYDFLDYNWEGSVYNYLVFAIKEWNKRFINVPENYIKLVEAGISIHRLDFLKLEYFPKKEKLQKERDRQEQEYISDILKENK